MTVAVSRSSSMKKAKNKPAAEVVLTTLHAGGKFGDGGGYKVSGGLHGVGVSVVNALSERLDLEIWREGAVWTQSYERGKPLTKFKKGRPVKSTGTTITFVPDTEIFEDIEFDFDTLAERLRETAFLTRGLKVELIDERGAGRRVEFLYKGGIADFVKHLNESKDPLHRKIIYFEGETKDGQVEVAMQWNSSYQESIFSFANNINTHEGGTHLSGFRSALTRTLNAIARNRNLLKEKDENLSGEDVREGLTAVVSVKLADPQFEGQTKGKLGQPADRGPGQGGRQPAARRFPRGAPGRRPPDPGQGGGRGPGPRRRAQGARPDPAEVRARELDAARQARRLLGQGPRAGGAVHRRGRLGGRLGEAGPRPEHPGGAAAARQDHQRREEPDRQGPLQQRDPGADHGDRHRRFATNSRSTTSATTRSC